ncbi:retinoid-inducible serine carboxypeptidase-like isoform X5 [Lycorma delicatula]|uniref:retinoid-inducible serine carboxypeptidase-like isoform X5 n=1 Tax=Lycorma delicatula TaxID=130591 RepID=UPI003F519F84
MYKSVFCILTFFCVSTIFVTGKKGFGPGSQEYGYVEVRKGAHMFYWLYYINAVKESEATEHPLVIWLQGGPGASSTGYGNFEELGTLFKNLTERESAWTKHVNVLYIDNPVGSGFSYVENESLYVKTNHEIAVDLVTFTKEFYKKLKKFSETPLYIFAESYGGKMAIEFAYDLYQEIKNHNLKINFKGIALGDSWISPVDSCLTLAAYLLNFGEIDIEGYNTINNVAEVLKSEVESDQWSEATSTWSHLEFAVNMISGVDFFNIFYGNDHDDATLSNVERVLNETNLQVVVYSGQLDLIVNTPGTLNWVQRLHWPGAEKWKMAARPALKVESKQEGFIKAYDKFTFYWINRAGHMVPKDNPYGALEMLKQITHHKT